MNVVIHEDLGPGELSWTCARYVRILEHNGIRCVRTHLTQRDFWKKAAAADLFIFRCGLRDYDQQLAEIVLPVLGELMNVACFPNHRAKLLYEDKIRQSFALQSLGFDMPRSWVFFDRRAARDFVLEADYPLVFKLRRGAGSKGVALLSSPKEALRYTELMFGRGTTAETLPGATRRVVDEKGLIHAVRKSVGALRRSWSGEEIWASWQRERNYVYFQEYLPGNDHDTRVVVIGRRALAFQRLNRPGDFRASGSGLDRFDPALIDKRTVRIAFDVCARLGTPIMAFDFLEGADGAPKIVEMSFAYGSPRTGPRADSCPGYWTLDLEWVDEAVDTAHYELAELLGREDLRRLPKARAGEA